MSFDEKKLCTLIAGHKSSSHPNELYSERHKVIEWFETHHPKDFEFYGMGWDSLDSSQSMILKVLKKAKLLDYFPTKKFNTYFGPVDSKFSTFSNYKFSICFENAYDLDGYITEKIFDSFFASCVPIYWGANNIGDHIPENCYIAYTQFKSIEDMFQFIKNMREEEHRVYISNINTFLNSNSFLPFSHTFFAENISKIYHERN